MLVDTHCHLDAGYFAEGADAVIERARAEGVGAFVCIGVGGAEQARFALELAERRPDVVATCKNVQKKENSEKRKEQEI